MGSLIIKGKNDVFRGPLVTDGNEDGVRRVRFAYHGPYAKLNAMKPKTGDALAGFEGMNVRSAVAVRDENGYFGTLEIILESAESTTTLVPEGAPALTTTREILWQSAQRPLLEHPSVSGYAAELAAWMAESKPGLKKNFQYTKYKDGGDGEYVEDGVETLSQGAQKWALKIMRGIESWMDFYPLARLTTTHTWQPAATGAGRGTMGPPLGISVPAGYGWMRTGDTVTQNSADKIWTRVQEWTGLAGGWDVDIYGGNGL